ncbi:MAG: NAD(P)H-dependent oxidoreductase [Anaerolineae bacterium]
MKVLVIQSSPNRDGLTAACAAAAAEGAHQAGAAVTNVRLNDVPLERCRACERGWGTCLAEHRCQVGDGFQSVQAQVAAADAVVVVTPVYWGEPSESAKAFMDRFRRCEALRGDESALAGKRVLAVAAAGGSGGGTLMCLTELEHWMHHVSARRFDLLGVTQRNRGYMIAAVRSAASALVGSV